MKFDILVQTVVNDQPEHVFVQHHGVNEAKVDDLMREVIQEQYDRLERGKPAEYTFDRRYMRHGVVMSRRYDTGSVTTVNVFAVQTEEARDIWEAQERVRKGETAVPAG